jgi:hypothetical protein
MKRFLPVLVPALLGAFTALPLPALAQTGQDPAAREISLVALTSLEDAISAYQSVVAEQAAIAASDPEAAEEALSRAVAATQAISAAIGASGLSDPEIAAALAGVLETLTAALAPLDGLVPAGLIAQAVVDAVVAVVETAAVALSTPQPQLAAAIAVTVETVSASLSETALSAIASAVTAVGTGSYEGVTGGLSEAVSASAS